MKIQIKAVAIVLAIIVILAQLGVFNALLLFLLVGAVPGTGYSLPSSFMLIVMLTAIWLVFFRYAALKTFHYKVVRKAAKRSAEHKKRMPSRRFNQI